MTVDGGMSIKSLALVTVRGRRSAASQLNSMFKLPA